MLLRKAREDKENSIFCLDDIHNAFILPAFMPRSVAASKLQISFVK